MSPGNHLETVLVQESLCDVLAEAVASSFGQGEASIRIIDIGREQVVDCRGFRVQVSPVDGLEFIYFLDFWTQTSMDAEYLIFY